jgi:hypothetical protein
MRINLAISPNPLQLLLSLNRFGEPSGSYKFQFVNPKTNFKTDAVLINQGQGIAYFGYGNSKYNFKVTEEVTYEGKRYASIVPDNFTYEEFEQLTGLQITGV